MNGNLTIYDRIRFAAEKGKTSHVLMLWKSQIKELKAKGFCVEPIKSTKRVGEWLCVIKWEAPTIEQSTATEILKISLEAMGNTSK